MPQFVLCLQKRFLGVWTTNRFLDAASIVHAERVLNHNGCKRNVRRERFQCTGRVILIHQCFLGTHHMVWSAIFIDGNKHIILRHCKPSTIRHLTHEEANPEFILCQTKLCYDEGKGENLFQNLHGINLSNNDVSPTRPLHWRCKHIWKTRILGLVALWTFQICRKEIHTDDIYEEVNVIKQICWGCKL